MGLWRDFAACRRNKSTLGAEGGDAGRGGCRTWARRVANVGLWREFAACRRNKSTLGVDAGRSAEKT
ncbi:hypothetical protein OCO_08710 [Mycobacterium intracellulare MOTT-02]|nr:hypothetical protein OCO_08710 [Mycobacterium intracellulare MOTT-02]